MMYPSVRQSLGLMALMGGVVLWPTVSHAAAAGTVLAPVSAFFLAFIGLANMAAVFGVIYGGVRTIQSVYTERQEGNWMLYGLGTLAAGALAFVIIPLIVAPGVAAGATPDLIDPLMYAVEELL